MCRTSALWLMRRAYSAGELEILPCRSPRPAGALSPGERGRVPDRHAARAARTAARLSGADAVPELLRRIHGWGWLAGVFALPAGAAAGPAVSTRWVARNRMRISCALDRRA